MRDKKVECGFCWNIVPESELLDHIKKIHNEGTCSFPNCQNKRQGNSDLCLKHLKEHMETTDWSIQQAKDAGVWKDDD